MQAEARWYVAGRIVHARLVQLNSIQDAQQIDQLIRQYLDSGNGALVHLLLDHNALVKPALSPQESQQHTTYLRHPMLGWVVAYGGSRQLGAYSKALHNGTRFHRSPDLAHALRFLRDVDITLPDLNSGKLA